MKSAYGKLPLTFELNQGQADQSVKFLAHGKGYNLFLTPQEVALNLQPRIDSKSVKSAPKPTAPLKGSLPQFNATKKQKALPAANTFSSLYLRLIDANSQPQVSGVDELSGKTNYFLGNDPKQWHTNVSNFAKVKYANIYPGIDQIYYGNQQQLEYDFVVAPHADPGLIRLNFDGAMRIRLTAQGDIELFTKAGKVVQHKPIIYQTINGVKVEVAGKYILQPLNTVTFAIPAYNKDHELIIDPQLSYSTYLGGAGDDIGNGIAVDADGNTYVTGETLSVGSIPFQSNLGNATCAACRNIFVAKYDPSGATLLYTAYLGGNKTSRGRGIAVDANGNAYITGLTAASDFPTISGSRPLQVSKADILGDVYAETYLGSYTGDAFVAKLNASGSALLYSTYFGGGYYDEAFGIAVDATGNAYVTGQTASFNFPLKAAIQDYKGAYDAFIAKFNADGSDVIYSTCLGSSAQEDGRAIAIDTNGNAYITGTSYVGVFSPFSDTRYVFPTTTGAWSQVVIFMGQMLLFPN